LASLNTVSKLSSFSLLDQAGSPPCHTSTSESSLLEYVRYTHFVIIIIIILADVEPWWMFRGNTAWSASRPPAE